MAGLNRIAFLLVIICMPLVVSANHGWSDIDLCSIYKDRLPPGLTLDALPVAQSQGASLLGRYCTQCHNLPGPDRHTAAEWREVVPKMFMLMDVSNLFGTAGEVVETMLPESRAILLAYLERHAAISIDSTKQAAGEINRDSWLQRGLALFPFLLLTGLGLLRWRRTIQSRHKPCVID